MHRLTRRGLKLAVAALPGFASCAAPAPQAAAPQIVALDAGAQADGSGARSQSTDATPTADTAGHDAGMSDGMNGADGVPAAEDATAQKTAVIWVHHPAPATLVLRGSQAPLSWQADLTPQTVGDSAARFDVPAVQGPFQVKPMATGAWSIGANYVVQLAQPRHIYPYFDAKLAAPRRDDFSLPGPDGPPRVVRVRLPAGYDENTVATYPLLVMFDGQNVFDAQTATFGVAWELDDAIDASMAEAKLQEVIVAAIDHGGSKRIHEYTPWPDPKYAGGGGPDHLAWIHTQVLPALVKKYRLQPGASSRCIGGSSLGALMALYAVGAHPDQWSCAVAMSGAWWWAGLQVLTWLPTAPGVTGHPRLWLDVGTVKDGLQDTQAVRKKLLGLGWTDGASLGYFEAQGADHSEKAWAARAPMAVQFLFDPHDRAKPF
ncbi:MAG: alpha/beta hydrolase [Deltaproteobacteria bacterium]|nr:alpha/beta hydrolase [Deltaproteobacteria bacterium]